MSSAAHVVLWQLTNDIESLSRAIESACEAAEIDGTWPWPLFQLAELAGLPEPARAEAVRPFLSTPKYGPLLRMVRGGDAPELFRLGARLAVNNREFSRDEFGSRQLVYVLDDPHRLLKQSFVFKHTATANAYREIEAIKSFGAFLDVSAGPTYFKLPDPIGVVPAAEGEVAYVMRRARGWRLGDLTLGVPFVPPIPLLGLYGRTARYLAYYHAWGVRGNGRAVCDKGAVYRLAQRALGPWKSLGMNPEDIRSLAEELTSAVPVTLPSLLKKDAHPENWLVDSDANIVMLDLEANSFCPLFFELSQLIEDYPVFLPDEDGWSGRMDLCREYLRTLCELLGWNFDEYESRLPEAYAGFVLIRLAFGLGRIRARARWLTSSAVRASNIRDEHYQGLLRWMKGKGTANRWSRPAARMLDAVENLPQLRMS